MDNKKIYWFSMNGFFAIAMYFGFFQGNEAAEAVAIFIAWLSIIASLFVGSDALQESIRKTGRAMPRIYNISFDIFATLMLLYGGWWITAFFYMFHTFLQEEGFRKALEEK